MGVRGPGWEVAEWDEGQCGKRGLGPKRQRVSPPSAARVPPPALPTSQQPPPPCVCPLPLCPGAGGRLQRGPGGGGPGGAAGRAGRQPGGAEGL